MKKVLLLTLFFVGAPSFLLFTILYVLFLSYRSQPQAVLGTQIQTPSKNFAYAALPTSENIFNTTIDARDSRVEIVRQFFAKYQSPLEPYAESVVTAADFYGLDFRLVPAIAMQESNLCRKIPNNSYNCWGFGIYGSQTKRFEDYKQAIDAVTKTLAKEYKDMRGLVTPEQIMTRYTPSSNGSWAAGVNHFMDVLQ